MKYTILGHAISQRACVVLLLNERRGAEKSLQYTLKRRQDITNYGDVLSSTLNMEVSFERCCRLCAEEQEVTIMIFSEEAEAMLLQNKLNKYLLIEVDEDDKLPKNICIRCCTKLQTVCDFIDTARKAQDILLSRSFMLDQISNNCISTMTIKSESFSDDESKVEMEVSVDPMMVLQNSEDPLSPNTIYNCHSVSESVEEITNLNSADGEYVTIKLIKKADTLPERQLLLNCNTDQEENIKEDCTQGNNAEGKPFQCKLCKRSFLTELALKNHSWTHINDDKSIKRYRCNHCDDSFNYKSELIAHLKEHRSRGRCGLCGRIFRSPENLEAHMALHSKPGKSYTCKVCGRSYSTRSNLATHSITHSSERPYKCHLCKKCFKRNQDLKFHINQHTGDKPYKCPFCDKSFASSGNCYSHRSRMHPGRVVDSKKVWRRNPTTHENQPPPKAILNKGVYKYQCTVCDHTFMRRDNFTYHMYQHTGQKPFQCTICSEKFVTRKGVLLHHDREHPGSDRPLALLSKNLLLK